MNSVLAANPDVGAERDVATTLAKVIGVLYLQHPGEWVCIGWHPFEDAPSVYRELSETELKTLDSVAFDPKGLGARTG